MQDARVRYALLTICLICLFGSGYVLLSGRQTPTQAAPKLIVITPPPREVAKATTPRLPTRIYVDVAGAVRRPALYVLPAESRVMQAILAAGGPTEDADMDAINLAQKVADGEKVFVPTRSAPSPDAPRTSSPLPHIKMGSTGRSNKISADSGEQIALNTATAEQLERLPGVGPNMAARILAYRQQANGFSKIEDLTQVTGIGPKKFAKIAPCVKLN